jgi:hypothetical protein
MILHWDEKPFNLKEIRLLHIPILNTWEPHTLEWHVVITNNLGSGSFDFQTFPLWASGCFIFLGLWNILVLWLTWLFIKPPTYLHLTKTFLCHIKIKCQVRVVRLCSMFDVKFTLVSNLWVLPILTFQYYNSGCGNRHNISMNFVTWKYWEFSESYVAFFFFNPFSPQVASAKKRPCFGHWLLFHYPWTACTVGNIQHNFSKNLMVGGTFFFKGLTFFKFLICIWGNEVISKI